MRRATVGCPWKGDETARGHLYRERMGSPEPIQEWFPAPPGDHEFDEARDAVFYRRFPLALDSIVRARTVEAVSASIEHGAAYLWPECAVRLEDVAVSLPEEPLVDEPPGHVMGHGRSAELRRRMYLRRCQAGIEAVALLGAHSTYLGRLVVTPPGPVGWVGRQERRHMHAYAEVCSAALHSCLALAELRRLALTDQLTGLPNRRALDHRLDQLDADGGPVAVVFCDADRLGLVNNELGYDAGNALIEALAASIRSALTDGDFAARMGGDEFVCLTGPDGAERLVANIECRFAAADLPEDVRSRSRGVSLGIAMGAAGEPGRDVLRRGAAAMRSRKATRKSAAAG
jgi:diguanylate cyclase (GGDEF)-like protein